MWFLLLFLISRANSACPANPFANQKYVCRFNPGRGIYVQLSVSANSVGSKDITPGTTTPEGIYLDCNCVSAALCSTYTCRTALWTLKTNSATITCAGSLCTDAVCCDPPLLCSSYQCKANYVLRSDASLVPCDSVCTDRCCVPQFTCKNYQCIKGTLQAGFAGKLCPPPNPCNDTVCCNPPIAKCSDYTCKQAGWSPKPSNSAFVCGTACSDLLCCAPPKCSSYTCQQGLLRTNAELLNCASSCSDITCCVPSCGDFTSCTGGLKLKAGASTIGCPLGTCTQALCCDTLQCSSYTCVTLSWRLRASPIPASAISCPVAGCNDDTCCTCSAVGQTPELTDCGSVPQCMPPGNPACATMASCSKDCGRGHCIYSQGKMACACDIQDCLGKNCIALANGTFGCST